MAKQSRFYILIAALIYSSKISDGYAANLGSINEVNFSTPYCASTGDEEPCLFCAPANISFSKEKYCASNACGIIDGESGHSHKRIYSGDYGYGFGLLSSGSGKTGYYECDTSQGWVYRATEPGTSGGDTCGSDNCVSSAWTAHRTGYEVQTYRYCSNNTCMSQAKYRCAKNYYGTSTNGTSGCTRCPSSSDYIATENSKQQFVSTGEKAVGMTLAAGNTTATRTCYIPGLGGSEMYLDSTGAYQFTSNCYWS